MSPRGLLASAADARAFVLAGDARFTLVSAATGTRFTYRVRAPEGRRGDVSHFVSVLAGQDNLSDYAYLGLLRQSPGGVRFERGRKSRVGPDAPSAVAIAWALPRVLNLGVIPPGLGPECASRMAA